MLNLSPHRRLHIPNSLAVFAVVLLIGSNVAGVNSDQNDLISANLPSISENEITIAAENVEKDSNVIGGTAKQKSHALKLGLQLFQR